jgi:energy-coupling factor transporter ATP-binding protein EcfA2
LTVQNLRCFGPSPQVLDLTDGKGRPAQWSVLLGNNGTGKTTLLQALVGLEDVDPKSDECIARAATLAWRNNVRGFNRGSADDYSEISARFQVGASLLDREAVASTRDGWLRVNGHGSSQHISLLRNAPPCCAYGAGRRMGTSSLSSENSEDATASLWRDDVFLRNAEEWLLQLDYAASTPSAVQRAQQRQLEQVKELLLRVLPDEEVSDLRKTVPRLKKERPRFEFETPYGWVPQSQLSFGFRTMIAWIVDFASRLFERYPESPDPLAEPAVCIVDEIDLHLHPRWQRKLLGYLSERFPNTQFIVTAHSPLVVQAASGINANLALLRREGDHVIIENDVDEIRGWRVDQILTSELFGLATARPPHMEQDILRREQF